jgi:UDP-N-acetylmuramoyl-tripeptide--D-alanyl-D-alanine ligase
MQRMRAGKITVINDAYNANPVSMGSALDAFAEMARGKGRRVFVCGDMLELGESAEAFHHQVGQRAAASGVGLVLAVGAFASAVAEGAREGGIDGKSTLVFSSTDALLKEVGQLVSAGDLVLIKGSRGMELERVVEALTERKVNRAAKKRRKK